VSVFVLGKFRGDTATFRQALIDRAGEFARIGEQAKVSGGIHHHFGIGDGFVVIVDEWGPSSSSSSFSPILNCRPLSVPWVPNPGRPNLP
jgi:hypothetical protein